MSLTADRLRELLDYDPETGLFQWRKVARKNKHKNKPPGRMLQGYLVICVDYQEYAAHRLAWLYMKGEWPLGRLDHHDTDKTNNKFSNLRPATNAENLSNRGKQSNNTSGYKGVSKSGGKWRATISHQSVQRHLGSFGTREEAHAAYCQAAAKMHGQFARGI